MSASVRTKRTFATGLAVVLTGGGLAAVAAPANAETGAVNYTCPVAGNSYQVSVNTDTNAPAKMFVGDTATIAVDSDVVLPPEMAKLAYDLLQARSFDGTVAAKATFSGADLTATETIPTTSLGDQSTATAVPFTAIASAVPLKATVAGDLALEAGDVTATLNFTKQDGTTQALQVNCTKPNSKVPAIDNVVVVSKSTTALTLTPATAGYGAPVTATAKVTTPGGTPEGDVTFVVGGVSTKVQVKDGAASLVIDQAVVGDNAVSATFTPKDAVHYEGSSATPANLKVSKASTSTKVKITGKRVRERTSATIKVVGINKTVPTGRVKLVLRKVGNQGFHKAKSGALAKGSRGFNLGRLGKGKYKVVVKYVGDANHLKSKTVKRFRVRP
ncbi:MAG: Ig-like domain-containing protein [Nocardioides sp.]|uniref:Ig-like domain-containing protein n=1 Tax=Nocardioides sp. TaxID=35761 RepID=UPI0032676E4C